MQNFNPEGLEERIGYKFKDRSLLRSALAHSSYTNEMKINRIADYQRLEFLGDAVLEVTVSDFLYKNHPEMPEGEMTKVRSSLVCEPTLAFCARAFSLSDFILLGKGEENQGSRYRDSIVSDIFEAIIGAIYIDGGMEPAAAHIKKYVLTDIEHKQLFHDSKSRLQILIQKRSGTLSYELIDESGPDHRKSFTVAAIINGERVAEGTGSSKKSAEQHAAYEALIKEGENVSGN
ncbi:ribonuclease-3 [Lachnospiraceae bacterium]|nr:ribonuclease-3 [Lachnospiraceae bacterium]